MLSQIYQQVLVIEDQPEENRQLHAALINNTIYVYRFLIFNNCLTL